MGKHKELSRLIKSEATRLGFSFCGIAKAEPLPDQQIRLRDWLNKGYHGEMTFMDRNIEKRTDPELLVDGAKSVVVVGLNYYQENIQVKSQPRFSRYAYGQDYHKVIKDKLYLLMETLKSEAGPVSGRVFVDSAPVLERVWAARTGMGWIGKNSMFLNRTDGSYLFLGELIVDIELEYDTQEHNDYCGSCTECIDACPTQAITEFKTINSTACLSYLTIEKKGDFDSTETKSLNGRVFGCDICQEVCPWNKKVKTTIEKTFTPIEEIAEYSTSDWKKITEDEFNSIFRNSPVLRAGFNGFKRNLRFL